MKLLKYPLISIFFGSSAVIFIISLLFLVIRLEEESGPFIILFNTYRESVDLSGGFWKIISLLGASLVYAALNFFIVYEIYSKERFLSYLIAGATALIALLTFFVAWNIISLN